MGITGPRFDVRIKAALITLVVAGISFPLTYLFWPPEVQAGAPATAQVLGFGLLAAECLAMGGGVAFLAFGYPALKRLPVSPGLAFAAYLGIGYSLVNWWTHDHLHVVAGSLNFSSWIWMTIAMEYIFHAGTMVFGGVLALFFAKILLARPGAQPATEAAAIRSLTAQATKELVVR